MISNLKWISKN